jgi:uncharacterized protein
LGLGCFKGYADFLVRTDGGSELGDYCYEAWDTKLALSPKPYFLVQLACYSEMLQAVQGVLPQRMHLLLGDKTSESFRTEDYLYHYRQVKESFLRQQSNFNPGHYLEFTGREDFGRWQSEIEKRIKESDHLCQVAHIRALQIKRLREHGLKTMTELAHTTVDSVPHMQAETFATLRRQARLQVQSLDLKVPAFELIEPQVPRSGLYLLPPTSSSDVYFDMEGYPLENDGLEYLFGVTIIEDGQPKFLDWWAHNAEQEKLAFQSFMTWLHDRWQKDRSLHVYHYASYEKTALQKLMGKYSIKENELDDLLRNEVFVDLFTVVRQSIKVGTPNYSIKSIEKLYRPKRDTEVATAMDSIVFYRHWLDKKDGDDWHTSEILKQIRDYNKDDCDSTWQLADWLRGLQKEANISWRAKEQKERSESESAQARNEAAALAKQLLNAVPADPSQKTDSLRIRELIAQLLEFHWRESRPIFWAMYNRHEMTERELYDDPCCLAGLKLRNDPRQDKQSYLYEYSFDPDQETKINAGNRCFFAHDLRSTIVVASIDPDYGIIVLRRSTRGEAPPESLNLIKDEFVNPAEIARSVFRTAQSYQQSGRLQPALEDFLARRRPRLLGLESGPLLRGEPERIAEETAELLARAQDTTICIQGPPGSGKTYTAAKAILHLLKQGKRIGVTSNSHKAIAHLMDKVADAAHSEQIDLGAIKIQSESDDFHCQSPSIKSATPNQFFEGKYPNWQLVGGTAWAFSKEIAVGLLDYLFVDEAGQVSVANLVGMAPSTKNIVLIGDQMQLSQPIKGVHPGESGKSVLDYLLQGEAVVDWNFGIFLERSWRMHPDLCRFISGAVYNDLLQPDASTVLRNLQRSPSNKLISKDAGVLYLPVEHEGNSQCSDEEVDTIAAIVQELKQTRVSELNSRGQSHDRPFDVSQDLLVVAPYNMQVRKLHHCLPEITVGSVDKFQGQEASVVIVSMCSSTGDASPRGLEFIFNKNRLNVAISRAKILAIVVGSPQLASTKCRRVDQLELVNLFCRVVEYGSQSGRRVESLASQLTTCV